MFLKHYLVFVLGIFSVTESKDYCAGHFERCICTDEKVECHNERRLNGDITKLLHYIKDNVTEITITGSKLIELPRNTFGSCRKDSSLILKKLKLVDLSNNSISTIHSKSIHCVPNLETLILSDNAWEIDKYWDMTGYFASISNLKHLDMTNAFKEDIDGRIHMQKLARIFKDTDMTSLETLKLGHNEFFSLSMSSENSLCQLTSLKSLDLSHNKLQNPSFPNKADCLENVESLDFSYNQMPMLSQQFMDKLNHLRKLRDVKLDNNPFICDCGLAETWKWLNSTDVPVNKNDLICAGGYYSPNTNKPILNLSLSDLCEVLELSLNTAAKAGAGITLAVLGLVLIAF